MTDTIYRNFMQVSDAEQARNALLADGFPYSSVKLTPHKALEPNTTVSTVQNIMDSLTPDSVDGTDDPRPRPVALVAVDVLDNDQRRQADAIMRRFNAIEA
ncbi:hypothetical protein [Pseudoduganella namucuonensis]|uniref:Uncharacterized protein n=1 Tax=Pseudoduganella namucuonensis TaxID=1035707 RepID=A0A1I7I5N1_9BURK|nr:hypothetical protein [Pseudoduganella namucuonensis]SFU68224.1 hypothetical protein SAMN05216552_1007112 [Pseudoduganella namucuonensis]